MLARRSRVPAETMKDLRKLRKKNSAFFILYSAENGLGRPRFSVVVSTKVDRRAVRRHTLKRRAANILIRQEKGGKDMILTVLPPAAELTAAVFAREISKLT